MPTLDELNKAGIPIVKLTYNDGKQVYATQDRFGVKRQIQNADDASIGALGFDVSKITTHKADDWWRGTSGANFDIGGANQFFSQQLSDINAERNANKLVQDSIAAGNTPDKIISKPDPNLGMGRGFTAAASSIEPANLPSSGLQFPSFDQNLRQVYSQRQDLQALYNPDGTAKNPNDPKVAGTPTLADWAKKFGVNEEPLLKTALANATGNNAPTGTGGTAGSVAGVSTYQDSNQMKSEAAAAANKAAQDLFNSLGSKDVETRKSSQILADIEKTIETPPAKPVSLVEQFTKLKSELGIDPLQVQLTNLDNELRALDSALLTEGDKAGDRQVSMTEINRRRSTLQKETDIRKAYLNVERTAVATQLQNKLSTLETIMTLTNQDMANATNYYNTELNKNMQLYNLYSQKEQQQQTQKDKARTEANASLVTVTNLIKDGATLTDAQKTQVRQLELTAGLPVGITEAVITGNNDKVLAHTTLTEPSGKTYYTTLMQKPNGEQYVVKTYQGQEKPKSSDSPDKITKADATNAITAKWKNENFIQGNGKISSGDYKAGKEWWVLKGLSAGEYDIQFNDLIDKSGDNWKKDYGYGVN